LESNTVMCGTMVEWRDGPSWLRDDDDNVVRNALCDGVDVWYGC